MKGLDSFDGPAEQKQANNPIYVRDFQAMLDEEAEQSCQGMEKKRRLNVDQVKALEMNFEVDNKLEPQRKLKLAQELGLQSRQVAVWFQNRRARWKTKQLETDYSVLKGEYDALKHNLEKLHQENEAFLKEIEDLKSHLKENGEKGDILKKQTPITDSDAQKNAEIALDPKEVKIQMGKDILGGNSDSDSSAIVNEGNSNSPTAAISSSGGHFPAPQIIPSVEISDKDTIFGEAHKAYYHTHFVKIEEHYFLGEDSCSSFFAENQAPSLHWYD